MKSSQPHSISPFTVVPRIRLSRSFAALFAAALAMGLGVESALAQGGYYPQAALLGGAPFIPNGFPVVSNAELNLIESKMPLNRTLVIPAVLPKLAATLSDYKIAVKAAATEVANGGGAPVTLATLAAEVAKFRQAPPSQVGAGLGEIAAGIIASGSGTKAADLQAVAFNAAKVDPAGATSGSASGNTLFLVFDQASKNGLAASVGAIANSALLGAVAGNPPPVAVSSVGIKGLVGNAIAAITSNPGLTPATKTALVTGLPATIMVNPTIAASPTNIDQASAALFANAGTVTASSMATAISGVIPVTNANWGAIAQGGLRANPANAAALTAVLGGNAYTSDLIAAFGAFGANPAAAAGLTFTYDAAAVAAAGATKFNASAPTIVKDVLNQVGAGGVVAQEIIRRGVAAAIGTVPQNIASMAVGAGTATPADVTTGATTGAPIASAGVIAKAVIVAAGFGGTNPADVGDAAIKAAALVSPANVTDAYSDIAFNLADALKGTPATADARTQAALAAEMAAIATVNGGAATAPTYIAVVAAGAGAPANRPGILTNYAAMVAGDDDAASAAGISMLNAITNVPLSNYAATLAAASAAASDAEALAVLYAASLLNPGEAAGGLAALIAKSGTSPAALTAAAVSANRSKQTALTIAADVAVYAKANPTGDIQATIGHQILDNPTYVKEIAAAATVVLPKFSHNIAHTVAFNQPKLAFNSVATIFLYSRITNTVGVVGTDKLSAGDRPGASAAVTAAFTTGILESELSAADRKTALQLAIVESVKALVNPLYNDIRVGAISDFRQSTGVTPASFTIVKAKGVAGGITGFVAQLVKTTDTAAVVAPGTDIYNALFHASYNAGLYTGTTYQLDIVQAAAQAFGWITGIGVSTPALEEIANAVYLGYGSSGGAPQLAKLKNAVAFGLSEGADPLGVPLVGNIPGAGAFGLRNGGDPAYTHHSASGTPVSNIFSL